MARGKKGLLTDVGKNVPKFSNPYKTPTEKGQRKSMKDYYKN